MASEDPCQSLEDLNLDQETPNKSYLSRLNLPHIDVGICNGVLCVSYGEPYDIHMEKLKTFHIREDDILICAFPRSGTHWIFRMVDMLLAGQAHFRDIHVDQVNLDTQRLEDLDGYPSPRILHTHVPYNQLPCQVKDKRPKIIHTYRNPKPQLVSLYFLLKKHLEQFKTNAMESALEIILKCWPNYMDEVTRFKKDYPELPVLEISYEEIAENSLETVKKLSKFLNLDGQEELYEQIAEKCRFDNQKQQEEILNIRSNANYEYLRQGDCSSWEKTLTVAHSEAIDAMLLERRDRCSIAAKYCPSLKTTF